jgi:hypothetical protein
MCDVPSRLLPRETLTTCRFVDRFVRRVEVSAKKPPDSSIGHKEVPSYLRGYQIHLSFHSTFQVSKLNNLFSFLFFVDRGRHLSVDL